MALAMLHQLDTALEPAPLLRRVPLAERHGFDPTLRLWHRGAVEPEAGVIVGRQRRLEARNVHDPGAVVARVKRLLAVGREAGVTEGVDQVCIAGRETHEELLAAVLADAGQGAVDEA